MNLFIYPIQTLLPNLPMDSYGVLSPEQTEPNFYTSETPSYGVPIFSVL